MGEIVFSFSHAVQASSKIAAPAIAALFFRNTVVR
jgi:hypothetical protein